MKKSTEQIRLDGYRKRESNWKNWGPYLSERAWGTVREDYSEFGTSWDYFPHDHARSRAYRWNEDGLAGISDRYQYLCFAVALWNGKDPILKERLYGLSGAEGNHGEDVKEQYFYLDSTPTHSYMKYLYKYPQSRFPYTELITENQQRGRTEPEFELVDTGIFDQNKYFDVFVEYAKADENDILIKISAFNRGPEDAELHLLPTLWYRNTWSWGYTAGPMGDVKEKPVMKQVDSAGNYLIVEGTHATQGQYYLYAQDAFDLLFTENETNNQRLYNIENENPHKKDSFHRYLIEVDKDAVNPEKSGTKVAAYFHKVIESGQSYSIQLRLSKKIHSKPFNQFDDLFSRRISEANEFYAAIQPKDFSEDMASIQRQAFAGMLWNKQLYYYDVEQWLQGDPGTPTPPERRKQGRNHQWAHLTNFDIISMPDKWEYPWYAAWDLAFHTIPLAVIDSDFAKRQLVLMAREWYMHPNGQLPAYEWALGDVNPPVHAWAVWKVYEIDAKARGKPDREFLERVFQKLLLNFTWWTNRKDADGNNIFQGGFLGLDNISVFDRSHQLPTGGHIDQSDGTAWMAFYSLVMLKISLELAKEKPIYQDLASKFYEHFLGIANAMTNCGGQGHCLWNDIDNFFYDALHLPDGSIMPLKVRSLVGLMPLIAIETLEPEVLETMPDFARRMHWFTEQRPHLSGNMASVEVEGVGKRHIVSILTRERLISELRYLLDPNEFLSEYGIRSVSKYHQENPYQFSYQGEEFSINYQPAESESGLFGGNSNWRGPIWFPINFLIIESLYKFYDYYGDDLMIECPTGSGNYMNLQQVAQDLSDRLIKLFLKNEEGNRPINIDNMEYKDNPDWNNYILFYEYFNGENGSGLGAGHQTGWTGLVGYLLQQTKQPR
ncbi:MAG: glucosidase [Chloroflexi bacterium HGW-Chloroflexi-2]|nr:MAG: glucosidase [Chloroflexi bacterium HGW-Chloroflexi-2]